MENNKEEYLYTDYAIQMLSAFMTKDTKSLSSLLDTMEDEMIDNNFLAGITFGLLIHIEQLLNGIALEKDMDVDDVYQMYALHYSSIRDDYKKILPLSPSFTKNKLEEVVEKLNLHLNLRQEEEL